MGALPDRHLADTRPFKNRYKPYIYDLLTKVSFCNPLISIRYHFVTTSLLLRHHLAAIFAVILLLSN